MPIVITVLRPAVDDEDLLLHAGRGESPGPE